jgi:hypothetical protein
MKDNVHSPGELTDRVVTQFRRSRARREGVDVRWRWMGGGRIVIGEGKGTGPGLRLKPANGSIN